MNMLSLAQLKQSNGYGRARNDEIFNLHLRSGAQALEFTSPVSCKTATRSIDSTCPNNQHVLRHVPREPNP